MFINRIFTRIHKLRNTLTINNNVLIQTGHRQLSTKPLLIRSNVYYTPKRNVANTGWKQSVVEKLKISDNVPENYELIYRCTMASYLAAAQISVSVGVVVVIGFAVIHYFTELKNDFIIDVPHVELLNMEDTKLQMIIFSSSFVLLNLAILLFIRKFPVRIYFDSKNDNFIGVLFGMIPKSKTLIEFKAGEVIHTPRHGIIPWNENRYKLRNGKKLVLLDLYFRRPNDINVMLGQTKL